MDDDELETLIILWCGEPEETIMATLQAMLSDAVWRNDRLDALGRAARYSLAVRTIAGRFGLIDDGRQQQDFWRVAIASDLDQQACNRVADNCDFLTASRK